jgi:hypothetical protein
MRGWIIRTATEPSATGQLEPDVGQVYHVVRMTGRDRGGRVDGLSLYTDDPRPLVTYSMSGSGYEANVPSYEGRYVATRLHYDVELGRWYATLRKAAKP